MTDFWKKGVPTWVWFILVIGASLDATLWAYYSDLFDLKLGITLVIIEVPLALIGSVIIRIILNESRENAEAAKRVQDKEKHVQNLNEKIFSKLVDVEPRVAPHLRKLILMIPRHYDKYQAFKKDAFLPFEEEDLSFEPIQVLPKPLFEWGMKHLESYDEINKSWNKLITSVDDYNIVNESMERTLRQKIVIEAIQFKGFKPIDSKGKVEENNFYDPVDIFRLAYSTFKKKTENSIEPTFDDLELQNINGIYHVIVKKSNSYIFESPQMISLEKAKEFLLTICNDQDLQTGFRIMENYRVRAWDEAKKYAKLLAVLVSKINEGMSLEGKCELGY